MATLQRARFVFDDAPDFAGIDGYHDPADTWNGWAKPYVTAEVAATLYETLANVTDVRDGCDNRGTHFKWFPRTRVLVEVANGDEHPDGCVRHECMLATRETVDGPIPLYPIAAGLCWSAVPDGE